MESQKTSTKEGRQSNPIDDEEVEDLYMDYDDQCPNCKLYVINEFYVKDYDQKLFACRNCKAHFIGVSYYPYNRRTKWIPTALHWFVENKHVLLGG